ncbi:MAG: hypothetical protein R3C68_19440, partial [Myxococcota bacterium]
MHHSFYKWVAVATLSVVLGCGRGGFEFIQTKPQYKVGDPCDEPINIPTHCGVGACANTQGHLTCNANIVVDTCDPFSLAAANDATCNNIDDDCDGSIDEDYVETPTQCGSGVCQSNTGILTCVAGVVTDTCNPLLPPAADDTTCNNVDDDCDGSFDEDFVESSTSCGVGACAGGTGILTCNGGSLSDSCVPMPPLAADDTTC